MNWQDLGGSLIRAGAPIIGNALGGPLGGAIGNALGGVLATALGTDATPEAVDDALKTTPAGELQDRLAAADSAAVVRYQYLAELGKADADAAARALVELQATIRSEVLASDPLQRWWRPIYAFELTLECALVWAIAIADLLYGNGKVATFVAGASGLLSIYWGARFGVLGVYVNGRSREKEVVATGQLTPSMIDQIVKAVRGVRR